MECLIIIHQDMYYNLIKLNLIKLDNFSKISLFYQILNELFFIHKFLILILNNYNYKLLFIL